MKGFKWTLFLFIIWWSIVSASVEDHSALKTKSTYQGITFKEIDLNAADKPMVNMASDIFNYNQDSFYIEDLQKICHNQVNEFVWKSPTISEHEHKHLKFRTIESIDGKRDASVLTWYLKSINEIDIYEMHPRTYMHQIQFHVKTDKQTILLTALYPTFPEISGFEVLQFISNLAFQCKFFIEVYDAADVSYIYSALYGKRYYEYHFKGVDLRQNFLFKKIIVKKEIFLSCFKKNITYYITRLSKTFYENIQLCENENASVEFCPITFDTHYIFYRQSFQYCIDWSPIGRFPVIGPSFFSERFQIFSKDITRIMTKKKQSNVSFVKINWELDKNIIKTYDEIKTSIFDTSFLMELFFKIFEFCFLNWKNKNLTPILKIFLSFIYDHV